MQHDAISARDTPSGAPAEYRGIRKQEPSLYAADRYDFVAELSPGVWKVCRRDDRIDFLAEDVTEELEMPDGSATSLGYLIDMQTWNMLWPVKTLLNHENLVSIVDCVEVLSGTVPRQLHYYIIWDFCNAGNLGNLLVPPERTTPHDANAVDRTPRPGLDADGDTYMIDAGTETEPQPRRFLPEALCWHVLVSTLRALTWLHNGVRHHFFPEMGKMEELRVDVDWHTVLHRDIKPSNMFFTHPRGNETYGICKLGNFGRAFVSGHVNGILGHVVPEAEGKVLTSYGDGLVPLDDLCKHEREIPKCHPPMPYTMYSEYRALADVIMSMMIEPESAVGDDHLAWVRQQDSWSKINSQACDYSRDLKDMVYELKSNTDVHVFQATRILYKRAVTLYLGFRKKADEGRTVVNVGTVMRKQYFRKLDDANHDTALAFQVQNVLWNQDRAFAKKPSGPADLTAYQERERLTAELQALCAEVMS